MSDGEKSISDGASWTVFVDRRGGRILLVGHHGREGYDSALLDYEADDGSVRVWRNQRHDLVAAEATIGNFTEDAMSQLRKYREATDRLVTFADAERSWFEPADLIRMISLDDDGAQSFLTYGTGGPKTPLEREEAADAAFMDALNQARQDQERL